MKNKLMPEIASEIKNKNKLCNWEEKILKKNVITSYSASRAPVSQAGSLDREQHSAWTRIYILIKTSSCNI